MLKIFYTVICLFLLSQVINSQTLSDSIKTETKTLSRLKLAPGYASGSIFEAGKNISFLDFGYRATELKKDYSGFEFGLSFNAGIIIYTNGFFPLYAKGGPEFKLSRDFIVGANFGFMTKPIIPVFAYGFNGSYLFNLSRNIYLELESGINFGIPGIGYGMEDIPMFYVSLGFSVN